VRARRDRVEAEINFVPHSGPFARGIHVTCRRSAQADRSAAPWRAGRYTRLSVRARVRRRAGIKDVAASNYANLSA